MFQPLFCLVLLASLVPNASAQNLLCNGSFEERDPTSADRPGSWSDIVANTSSLEFASEHHDGAQSAMIVADGKDHSWRQTVEHPTERAYTLSAMVKTQDLDLSANGDYAFVYGHIIYKGLAYSNATHFFIKIPPGTADWKRLTVSTQTSNDTPIEKILITVNGKLSAGRV